jgi:hypothetical protein
MILHCKPLRQAVVKALQERCQEIASQKNWLSLMFDHEYHACLAFLDAVLAYEQGRNFEIRLSPLRGLMTGGLLSQEDAAELMHKILKRVDLRALGFNQREDVQLQSPFALWDKEGKYKPELFIQLKNLGNGSASAQELLDRRLMWNPPVERSDPRETDFGPATISREKLTLERNPDFFILELVRHRFDRSLQASVKINTSVRVPLQLRMNADIYQLDSFVQHIGSAYGGHYVAYINKNGTWYIADDSRVQPVSQAVLERALSQSYFCNFRKLQ